MHCLGYLPIQLRWSTYVLYRPSLYIDSYLFYSVFLMLITCLSYLLVVCEIGSDFSSLNCGFYWKVNQIHRWGNQHSGNIRGVLSLVEGARYHNSPGTFDSIEYPNTSLNPLSLLHSAIIMVWISDRCLRMDFIFAAFPVPSISPAVPTVLTGTQEKKNRGQAILG